MLSNEGPQTCLNNLNFWQRGQLEVDGLVRCGGSQSWASVVGLV